jgi:hypothetical protein
MQLILGPFLAHFWGGTIGGLDLFFVVCVFIM